MIAYRTHTVEGIKLFYREAGPADGPVVLLLHGWPSSSHMFRELMPKLAHRFRLIAPDYPGFGFSDAPDSSAFAYTFDHYAEVIERLIDDLGITKVSLYIQDYGGPIGLRIAVKRPDLIRAIVVQNAVAHLEGVAPSLAPLTSYWENQDAEHEAAVRALLTPEITRWQYLEGAHAPEDIAPESYTLDTHLLARPGNDRIQLALFLDYRSNPARFGEWQAYLRERKPPMLVIWGKNDPFFTVAGAEAFVRDNPNATLTLLDGGHFALEEHSDRIAAEMIALADRVKAGAYA